MATEARGKKRSKSQYQSTAGGKRQRSGRELEVGMQGMLITCNMNQRKCTAEAYSLLNEYADQLYGPEKFAEDDGQSKSEGEESEDDVETALKKEVNQIYTSTARQLRRFQALESGANNVVFIRTLNIEPDKLVHHILKDLHTTKKKKTRAILRMLPVSGSCKAFMEEIPRYFETFMEPWFKAPKKATFQIVYKARNNSHMSRDNVIKALAGVVISLNPENKVDLNNPEYTIIVEIIKSVCCVSVVQDYILFRKYNLQEVAKSETEESRGTQPEPDRSRCVIEPREGKEAEIKSSGEEQETSGTGESERPQEATSQQ